MTKYYEIKPLTFGFNGTFNLLCNRFNLSQESLAVALGFTDYTSMMSKIIFNDITDIAYVERINNFLRRNNSSLRISYPMVNLKNLRWFNDKANKKR